jgi:hypothetical protein
MNINNVNSAKGNFFYMKNKSENLNNTHANNSISKQNKSLNIKLVNNEDNMSFEDSMYNDVLISADMTYIGGDDVDKIDFITDKTKKYIDYINKNFQGEEKDHYLSVLNEVSNKVKGDIAEQISKGFSNFLNLNEKDTASLKDNVISIINNKISGKVDEDRINSSESLDYKGLKNLNAAIKGISKDFLDVNISVGFFDVTGRSSYLGLAMMKANFISEKTNIPDKFKNKLLEVVGAKVDGENKHTLINQAVFESLQGNSKTRLKNESYYSWAKDIVPEKIKDIIYNTYKDFKNMKFDNVNFRSQFMDLLNHIDSLYSKNIEYNQNKDSESGKNISGSLKEAKNKINDAITSSWNDFLNKININEDKSSYYFTASNHNLIDNLA